MRLNQFTKKTPVLGRLLVLLVAFALGAVAGIVVDRLDWVTALKNRLDPRMAALESRAGMEADLTQELFDFEESAYLARRKAYQAGLDFDGSTPPARLEAIGKTVRHDYLHSLQPQPHRSSIEALRVVDLEQGANYRTQHVTFLNANGLTVRGILSTPTGGKKSYPVIVVPTGAWATEYDLFSIPSMDYHHDVGHRFAGDYVVFGLDLPNKDDGVFKLANAGGQSEDYYLTCDKVSSALDFVLENPIADETRIGIYGISLGGFAAILSAVCDERIDVVAASGTNVFASQSSLNSRRSGLRAGDRISVQQRANAGGVPAAVFPVPQARDHGDAYAGHDRGSTPRRCTTARNVLDFYKFRGEPDNAFRVVFDGDTCNSAWKHHCMEVTRVKQAFDALFIHADASGHS